MASRDHHDDDDYESQHQSQPLHGAQPAVAQPHYANAYRAPALQQQRSGLQQQYSGLPHQVSGGGATYPLGAQQYGGNRQSSGQVQGERQSLGDVPPASPQGYRPRQKQGQAYYL